MPTLEEQLRRKRFDASAKDIQRRHRQGQQAAERLRNRIGGSETPPSGVHPDFQAQLDAARRRAKAAAQHDTRSDLDHQLERLRAEGKLPPLERADNVGYEPTPEEVLGDLAAPSEPSAPNGEEWAPDAEAVLSSDPPTVDASPEPVSQPVQQPAKQQKLARPAAVRQSTGKRKRR